MRLLVDSGNYFTRTGNDELRVIRNSSEIEVFPEEEKIEIIVSPPQSERILEISGSDMIAVVDGGVKVSEFVDAIEKEGLFFPVGTLLFDNITMAQMIDDGFISDLESGFGRLREYILSLEIVTSAGEVISSGSRSVKDVTGYNITGFVYGAMGRCGLVTKVVAKLIPIFEYTRMIAYSGNLNILERLSSRINFEVGSVCQTIYYTESLAHIYEAGEWGDDTITVKQRSGPNKNISFTKTELEAVLTVRLESGSEDALGRAEDTIEKIVASNSVGVQRVHESELTGRTIIDRLLKTDEECVAAIHISFYLQADVESPVGGLVWENLYPRRIHYVLPCREETRLCDLRRTGISRYLCESGWNLTGLRVECIVPIGNSLEKLPVGDERLIEYLFRSKDTEDVKIAEILKDVFLFFYGDSYRDESEGDSVNESFSTRESGQINRNNVRRLNSRLLRLFDPERIIINK
ncbi:FAD-binding oxidoreductase [bacterium]|nr:FAD-binding oxidoreductase [bacterium]